MSEEEPGLVIQCKQAPPVARPIERSLDLAPVLSEEETQKHMRKDSGPFTPGLRICCPLVSFAQRKTEHCKACPFFGGAATRIIHGATGSDDDPRLAASKFLIICEHPTARSLNHFPED